MIARLVFLFLFLGSAAMAEPLRYRLDQARSETYFFYEFSGQKVRGTFPVTHADLLIDFAALGQSRIDVSADVNGTKAGFAFATQALKGPAMLDAAQFPTIRFASTLVTPEGDGARVMGDLTLHGQTHAVTLSASIFRQRGTEAGDRRRLSILLEGSVSRAAFGVDGFPDMVGDQVDLKILARINLAE